MATVQQVRDLRAEGAPADLSPDSDMESPSMKAARELGYTASAFAPDDAASPLPDIEPVFGRPRTPQPYDYTPPPNLLEALRGALPYWGQGDEETETNAKNDIQNASDEEINRVDPETGDTPLLLSAQYGAGDLVEMLLERGADVDVALPSGATALHYMTNSSTLCPDAVIALLAVGADPGVADQHSGATALMYAADAGHLRLCEQLVKHGADASQTDFQGYDAAGWARSAGHSDVEAFLTSKTTDALSSPVATDYITLPSGATVVVPESASKARRRDREAALHEQIRELTEAKAAEERRQRLAAEAQAAEAERKLRAAEAAAADKKRREAAAAAEAERRRRAANEAINAFDNYGYTKLNWAAYKGDVRKTRELLQAGADPNIIAKGDRMTPLAHAAWAGHPEIAQILLNHPWMDVKKFGKHALRMANLPMDSGTRTWASDCNFGGLEGRKAVGDMIRARCPDLINYHNEECCAVG